MLKLYFVTYYRKLIVLILLFSFYIFWFILLASISVGPPLTTLPNCHLYLHLKLGFLQDRKVCTNQNTSYMNMQVIYLRENWDVNMF